MLFFWSKLGLQDERVLDATAIHPESYAAAETLLVGLGLQHYGQLGSAAATEAISRCCGPATSAWLVDEKLAAAATAGATVRAAPAGIRAEIDKLAGGLELQPLLLLQLLEEFARPRVGDARDVLDAPAFRAKYVTMEDVGEGTVLNGTVRSVTDFGAFVDVGLHTDGLLHSSKLRLSPRPVMPGQPVSVVVLAIDRVRNRISLAFAEEEAAGDRQTARDRGGGGGGGQPGPAKLNSTRRGKRKAPELGGGAGHRPSKRA